MNILDCDVSLDEGVTVPKLDGPHVLDSIHQVQPDIQSSHSALNEPKVMMRDMLRTPELTLLRKRSDE
jgi:hypothetical protein